MKNYPILVLICIFMLVPVLAVHAQLTGIGTTLAQDVPVRDIRVNFIGQDPAPVEPGEFVELRWKIENFGTISIEDAQVEIVTDYPFTLDDENNRVKSVGTISPRQIGDEGVILEWRVRVDEMAVEGDEEIELKYKIGGAYVKSQPFDISIRTRDIIIGVEDIKITPERPVPGENINVTITLKNKADTSVDDVKVRLGLDQANFAPIGSSNEKTIRKISGKGSETVNFQLAVDANAMSKVHKIPLSILFKDKFNEQFAMDTTFGCIVDSPPDYIINLEETNVYTKGDNGEIVISISNVGVSNINFVTLELTNTEDYDVIGNKLYYLGNLESDDFETGEFDIYIKDGEDEIPLKTTLTYKDSFNREYEKQIDIPLKVYTSSQAKKFGLKEGNGLTGTIVVILIILVIAYFVFKRRTKCKNYKEVFKKLRSYL